MGRVSEGKRRRKNIKKEKVSEKEDPGARKGRKVARHCVFPMICGSGGSKSRLAKAASAEPAGQMRDEKIACRCGVKHISKSKAQKTAGYGGFSTFRCAFAWQAQGIAHLVKIEKNVRVL